MYSEIDFISVLIGSGVLLCFLLLMYYCCCRYNAEHRKVTVIVNVKAPVEWVWETWPTQYEMSRVYGVRRDGTAIKGGIKTQFPSKEYPRVGSTIDYYSASGFRITEEVLVRDKASKTF